MTEPGLLRAANAVGALATAAFAVVGAARPGYVAPDEPVTPLAAFWSRAAAARTLPLSAAVLVELARRRSRTRVPLLVVAGLAQVGDTALGVARRNPGMALGSAGTAALHLATALGEQRSRRSRRQRPAAPPRTGEGSSAPVRPTRIRP